MAQFIFSNKWFVCPFVGLISYRDKSCLVLSPSYLFSLAGDEMFSCSVYMEETGASSYLRNSKTTVKSEFFVNVSLPALRKTVIMKSDISLRVSIDTTHTSSTNTLQSVSGSLHSRLSRTALLQAPVGIKAFSIGLRYFTPQAASKQPLPFPLKYHVGILVTYLNLHSSNFQNLVMDIH